MLRAQAPGDGRDHKNCPQLRTLAPHALAVEQKATSGLPEDAGGLWYVLDDLVNHWRASGSVDQAIVLGRRCVAPSTEHFGEDDPNTLTSRNNLAGAYGSAGRLGEALAVVEPALAVAERVLDADHPVRQRLAEHVDRLRPSARGADAPTGRSGWLRRRRGR